MRLSERLRSEADHKLLVGDKFKETKAMLIQAADLLDVYYLQSKAVVVSKRLGEAKRNAMHSLQEDV